MIDPIGAILGALVVHAIVASQPDFGNYYPFYKRSSRSWFDFLIWESLYVAQFLGLEIVAKFGVEHEFGSGLKYLGHGAAQLRQEAHERRVMFGNLPVHGLGRRGPDQWPPGTGPA